MPQPASIQSSIVTSCNGDFRVFLGRELERRRKHNPRYSLRAFAKTLGLDSTHLSRMLRDKRPASPEFVERAGRCLGLSPKEIEAFRSIEAARKCMNGTAKRPSKTPYMALSKEVFETIEDWIAAAMKIPSSEVEVYIERLKRVGLLRVLEDGSWIDCSSGSATTGLSDFETSQALRRAQKRFLSLAAESLETVPIGRRDHSSIVMATHSSKVAGAKKIINQFRRDLCAFLEDCEEKNAVYSFSTALYPLVPKIEGDPDAEEK
jgi:transcriptional regulator with XRE-family HTH domain